MQFPRGRILIFARAPVPGGAKTRLIPALGTVGAARLAQALLEHLRKRLEGVRLSPLVLCCTPDIRHPAFHAWSVERWWQQGADLGERMHRAACRALEEGDKVLLIGTDCPELSGAYLRSAFQALEERDAVVGPARDGGYVLLGIRQPRAEVFRDIDWGTDRVLQQTLERFDTLGWSWISLPSLRDVDRPEDLGWLEREFPAICSGSAR